MIYKRTLPRAHFDLNLGGLELSLAAHKGLIRSDGTEVKEEFCKGIYFVKNMSVRP